MQHVLFSLSALLGTRIITPQGLPVGDIQDVVCNKDSGKMTYLILKAGKKDQFYAIHHSFFYMQGKDTRLIFDQKAGKEHNPLYLELPSLYQSQSVLSYWSFCRDILVQFEFTGHRSDND
jgi:sporulation protein YlmC with PRC-barrel domain